MPDIAALGPCSRRTLGRARVLFALLALIVVNVAAAGCARSPARQGMEALAELRREGRETSRAPVAARWLLAELISAGGDAKTATEARQKLDGLGGDDMLAHLARGIDDALHGKLRDAPDHYLAATRAARASADPRAPLIAWFAARQAVVLKDNARGLWPRWQRFVEEASRAPLNMGWRARSELVEWWAEEAYADATRDVEDRAAERFGCVKTLRMAGPFGRAAAADAYRSFPPEAPGPWPLRWDRAPGIGEAPRILATERHGCFVNADEPVSGGIFYAETFLELPQASELILAVQGAIAIWVDDALVLDRNPRKWGVWPRFGVELALEPGRHRVLARLGDAATSIRLLYPDGRAFSTKTSTDGAPPYSIVPPRVGSDPNALSAYIRDGNVVDPRDDLLRFIGAYLMNHEGQGDVAAVILEPLLKVPERATGPTLTMAAVYTENDPIFDPTQARDLVRELHERAAKKDKKLWQPRLALALWDVERRGKPEGARSVRELVDEFPQVPAVLQALSRLYGELGWSAEYSRTARLLAERFPDSPEALLAAVEVLDAQGERAKAEALVDRIHKLDPDGEIRLTRALAREDYQGALAELERLRKRRPDRADITERLYDVMVRAGNESETWKKLEAAVAKSARDEGARLALADAHYASGKHDALRRALVDAVVAGAPTQELKNGLDLVEGMSELEPYRVTALPVIAAYEKAGRHMPGTAARVLDYAAVWVRADGSSRMLEHEIIRIQSAEAIGKLAEHRRLDGLVLHMRVIKQDGRILEPEEVAGKPTLTFPHLEVGDYIETEHITTNPGAGQKGALYAGPHWFFREENVAYARSEFVVIAPKSRPIVFETRGNVPAPSVEERGAVVVRRWRVDFSPAAPSEPLSAPAAEFLPSVRVGWGIALEQRLLGLLDTVADVTPVDPRIVRIARRIVDPLPSSARTERAKRLYRWVLANVEDGPENDGRRVVVGKHGNRWRGFMTLCRALEIPVTYAVAKNRLAMPPTGPLSRASLFTEPVLVLKGERGDVWLTVSNKYAPFGYVPAELRGMPAYLLTGTTPRSTQTPSAGAQDSVSYEGDVELLADGSAKLEIVERFQGKYAMGLRSALAELPESRLKDVLESRLLGRDLRGARLVNYQLEELDDLDAPLGIRLRAEMAGFAQQSGGALVLPPPFTLRIGQLSALPSRQTPLLIAEATHREVKLRIKLPKGTRVSGALGPAKVVDADRVVTVSDRVEGSTLVLSRVIDVPAGRIQPADYARFAAFARRADDVQAAVIRIAR